MPLADVSCYKGVPLGLTRYLSAANANVLCFRKFIDNLVDSFVIGGKGGSRPSPIPLVTCLL